MAAPLGFPKPLHATLLDSQSLHTPQASAERYRAITDSSFDLICELDAECQFVCLSPSFGATTDLEPGALIGTGLIAKCTTALSGLRVGRVEHRLLHANGDWCWFESALQGIGARNKRHVAMVSREITSRQRHQLELETLIGFAKDVHLQSDLMGVSRSVWKNLLPLLPLHMLLLAWGNGYSKGSAFDVCVQSCDARFMELRDMGCAVAQGFFWAKLLSANALGALLLSKSESHKLKVALE